MPGVLATGGQARIGRLQTLVGVIGGHGGLNIA